MECCILAPNQKYQYKLDPNQTSSMIKFAVTRPKMRIMSIEHGLNVMLKWKDDPYLAHYGVKIDGNMTTVSYPFTFEILMDSYLYNIRLKLASFRTQSFSSIRPRLIPRLPVVGIYVERSSCSPTPNL